MSALGERLLDTCRRRDRVAFDECVAEVEELLEALVAYREDFPTEYEKVRARAIDVIAKANKVST